MQLTGFINYYCDVLASFANEFKKALPCDLVLSQDQERALCEYAVVKNKLAGVGKLNLSCSCPDLALNALKKYDMQGCAVVDDFEKCKEGCIFHIKDVLALSESQLQEYSMELGLKKKPCMITFGRSLYDMGQIDKTYNMSPVTFLEDMGFLDRECFILGGNFLDKDDLSLLSQYDATLILSPRSDMLAGRGFVNLAPLKSQNLTLGFASDIHPKVDMLGEGNLAVGQTANLMYDVNIVSLNEIGKFLLLRQPKIDIELFALQDEEVEQDAKLKARLMELKDELMPLLLQ